MAPVLLADHPAAPWGVGSCDIVRETFQTGELQELLKSTGVAVTQAA